MANAEPLTVEISLGLDRARVFLRGELDLATAPVLRERVGDLLVGNGQHRSLVVIDLKELTFCDSSGLRVLLQLADHSHRVGTTLRLTNISAQLQRVLDATGTTRTFNIDVDSVGSRRSR